MRHIIVIVFVLISSPILGQIIYEPIFLNPCTDSIINEIKWGLYDLESDTAYLPIDKLNKSIEIPQKGRYKLLTDYLEDFDIIIEEEGKLRDTIFFKSLKFYQNLGPSVYEYCDSLANGTLEDYYINGNIRIRGTFQNGQPVDSLIEYFEDGQIEEVFVPSDKGWRLWQYHENGAIKRENSTEDNMETMYFDNGQLKELWDRDKNVFKGFFSDGSLRFKGNEKRHVYYSKEKEKIGEIRRSRNWIEEINNRWMYEGNTKYFKYKMTFFKFDGEKDKVIIFSKIEWGNGLRYSTMFDTHTAIPYFDKIISKDDKGRKVVLKFIAKEDVEFEQIQNYIKERAIENSF